MSTPKPSLRTKLSTVLITLLIVFSAFLLIILNKGTDTYETIFEDFKYVLTLLNPTENSTSNPVTPNIPTELTKPQQETTEANELLNFPIVLTFSATEKEALLLQLENLQSGETENTSIIPTVHTKDLNGFSAESFPMYNLTITDNYGAHIQYTNVPDFAYVSKKIPLTYTNGQLTNAVSIEFENTDFSVSQIDFYLQGDQKLLLGDGETAVKEYFREFIGQYTKGQDGVINLVFDLTKALKSLEGKMTNGVSLVMLIESSPTVKSSERSGELTIRHISPLILNYANNTIQPWIINGKYKLEATPQRTLVTYKNINHFDNISTQVMNHQEICHYLKLELRNINHSVDTITINVYGQNNQAAFIPVYLSKYKSELVTLDFNLLEYNNQIGSVSHIELLIDSNPNLIQTNATGSLEIISLSFTSTK